MTNGTSQGLFVIVAVVIFGIFVLISYLLFRDNLKTSLSNIFTDGLEQATTALNNGTQSGAEGVTYEDWVEDLENKGYVVAEDTDFIGNGDGEFIYIGTDEKVIVPEIIKGVTITSVKNMFQITPVVAVAINNPNLIDMSYMFYNNQSTSLDVSNLVTENAWNMEGMFKGSKSESLDVSGFDTSKVTNMKYMFSGSRATSLDLSGFDTSKVTNMKYMFSGSKATKLDLSNFDTSKVTNMKNMFDSSQAESINLSSFDTSNVTNMANMFSYSKATSLDVSSFDTSKVTNMFSMFGHSKSENLDLSGFDTSNVTSMGDMFSNSQATTGYAKTIEDANKFNSSTGKPTTLTFVVK